MTFPFLSFAGQVLKACLKTKKTLVDTGYNNNKNRTKQMYDVIGKKSYLKLFEMKCPKLLYSSYLSCGHDRMLFAALYWVVFETQTSKDSPAA